MLRAFLDGQYMYARFHLVHFLLLAKARHARHELTESAAAIFWDKTPSGSFPVGL